MVPKEFIPLAEETGPYHPDRPLGLARGVPQGPMWQQEHDLADRLKMSVNISARHFQHEGLLEDVSKALRSSQLDPGVPGPRDNRELAGA